MSIYIYDTQGDPCFRSKRLDFDSWDEMVEYVNDKSDLKKRLETNWAFIRYEPYTESLFMEMLVVLQIMFSQKEREELLHELQIL